ncbi:MAG: head GIN domain-containing protein [Lentimicrobium sp.]
MKTIERSQLIISSTLLLLLALIILMLSATGCVSERIEGNYSVIVEERNPRPFSEVSSRGSFRVVIIPDDETRIEVKAESNVVPYIETWSDGTTLTVEYRNGYNIHEHYPVEVFLHTPVLESIRLSGSGKVESGSFSSDNADLQISGSGSIECDFNAGNLTANVSGSGNLKIGGIAESGNMKISGSGKIDALNMNLQTCLANISGSGNIITNVNESLEAWISGSGCVYYEGDPAIATHISGSGKVLPY